MGRGCRHRSRACSREKRPRKIARLRASRSPGGEGSVMATSKTIPRRKAASSPINGAGRFGPYGGRYVPETLMAALEELEQAYDKARRDKKFQRQLDDLRRNYAGRPTPLFFARRLTEKLG